MSSGSRAVLVTGAAGGLGASTAAFFARRGWRVFAADLHEPDASPGIVPIAMDVTDGESVAAALKAIEAECPDGLSAVVTFAGIMMVGPLIEFEDGDLRRMVDVNVLGMHRVIKAAFPLIHRGKGRVVTISSETGWQRALMLNGPYAMTKHAVEAYSDALRRELMFLGVPVSVVQPGPFRTGMVGGIEAAFERARSRSVLFPGLIDRVGRIAVREQERAHDPGLLADTIWTAATASRPKLRYSVRPDLRRVLLHAVPARAVDALLRRAFASAT
ncbi:SDR family NAD(P)-dependent oxidoreductase [Rhodococcus sp. NPDC055112]